MVTQTFRTTTTKKKLTETVSLTFLHRFYLMLCISITEYLMTHWKLLWYFQNFFLNSWMLHTFQVVQLICGAVRWHRWQNTVSICIRAILFGVIALTVLCGPCKFCNWTSMTTENTALAIWVARHTIDVYTVIVFYPHWSVLLVFSICKRLHKNSHKLTSAAISFHHIWRGNRKQTIIGAQALLRRQSTLHVYQSIAWNMTIEK